MDFYILNPSLNVILALFIWSMYNESSVFLFFLEVTVKRFCKCNAFNDNSDLNFFKIIIYFVPRIPRRTDGQYYELGIWQTMLSSHQSEVLQINDFKILQPLTPCCCTCATPPRTVVGLLSCPATVWSPGSRRCSCLTDNFF